MHLINKVGKWLAGEPWIIARLATVAAWCLVFNYGSVIGINRIVLEKLASGGQIATVKKQDRLRIEWQIESHQIAVGFTLHSEKFISVAIDVAGRQGMPFLVTDECHKFVTRLEVVPPHGHLIKNAYHGVGDDGEFIFSELIEWQPLDKNTVGCESFFRTLKVLFRVKTSGT